MNEFAIKAEGLVKSFGKFKAVDGIDINVRPGTVYGFLGPNGAGKTTVMRILLGLSLPDSGTVEIFGKSLYTEKDNILRQTGAVIESPSFFEYMTAYENLFFLSRMTAEISRDEVWRALEVVGLEKVAAKRVGTFSYGMKQRLGIAQALLPASRLIFLDEPTNGLDPHGILGVRQLIRRLCNEKGITFFISSHLLVEVENVCDNVTIIDKGVKICESRVSDLIDRHKRIEIKTDDENRFRDFCSARKICIIEDKISGDHRSFVICGDEEEIPALNCELIENEVRIFGISKHRTTLEEIFVEYTGKDSKNSVSDRF